MRMMAGSIAASLAILSWGCASESGMHASSPLSAPSSYSTSSMSAPSAPSFAPSHHASKAELIVRPDILEITFALRAKSADATSAVALLQGAVADLSRQVAAATNNLAAAKMCAMRFERGYAKSTEPSEQNVIAVAEGAIEVPLAPDLDYWAKARILGALSKVTSSASSGSKPTTDASFGPPLAHVKNVERYRADLVERWVRRARTFAQAAESAAAPLSIVDCAPPAEIQQEPVSLEEVGLSLAVTCKLDAVHSATASAAAAAAPR